MKITMNGKEISEVEAAKLIGIERLEQRIRESKEEHQMDPYTQLSYMDGMEFEF